MTYETDAYRIICEEEDAADALFCPLRAQAERLALLFGIPSLPPDCRIRVDILGREAFEREKSLRFGKSAGPEIVAFSTEHVCAASYRAVRGRYTPEAYRKVILHELVHVLQWISTRFRRSGISGCMRRRRVIWPGRPRTFRPWGTPCPGTRSGGISMRRRGVTASRIIWVQPCCPAVPLARPPLYAPASRAARPSARRPTPDCSNKPHRICPSPVGGGSLQKVNGLLVQAVPVVGDDADIRRPVHVHGDPPHKGPAAAIQLGQRLAQGKVPQARFHQQGQDEKDFSAAGALFAPASIIRLRSPAGLVSSSP